MRRCSASLVSSTSFSSRLTSVMSRSTWANPRRRPAALGVAWEASVSASSAAVVVVVVVVVAGSCRAVRMSLAQNRLPSRRTRHPSSSSRPAAAARRRWPAGSARSRASAG